MAIPIKLVNAENDPRLQRIFTLLKASGHGTIGRFVTEAILEKWKREEAKIVKQLKQKLNLDPDQELQTTQEFQKSLEQVQEQVQEQKQKSINQAKTEERSFDDIVKSLETNINPSRTAGLFPEGV